MINIGNINIKESKSLGFTLIEMLVSLAIFSIGITVLSQVLLDFLSLTRANFDVSQNLNDLRLFQEKFIKISRVSVLDLRDSQINSPVSSITTTTVTFLNTFINKRVKYSFDPQTKELKELIMEPYPSNIIDSQNLIISARTRVDNLSFIIQNYGCTDHLNPFVTVIIKFLPPLSIRGINPVPLYFQTTASQRCIEGLYSECSFQPSCN